MEIRMHGFGHLQNLHEHGLWVCGVSFWICKIVMRAISAVIVVWASSKVSAGFRRRINWTHALENAAWSGLNMGHIVQGNP